MEATSVPVAGGHLEVFAWGSGEPVVFIQTALTADELRPLAEDPALDGFRRVVYHRRGYAGSSPVEGHHSILRNAADCAEVLSGLMVDRAHLVGLSFSGAIGLQLAADRPELVRTLTLIEPPPVHTRSAAEFRAVTEQLIQTRVDDGPAAALEAFMIMLVGPDWRRIGEERLPGSSMQMQRDASTFFDTDLPALLDWDFAESDTRGIACPVLYIGGTESGRWFDEVRDVMQTWFPEADVVTVQGADHWLALTHVRQVARALAAFLGRQQT